MKIADSHYSELLEWEKKDSCDFPMRLARIGHTNTLFM